MSSQGLEVIDHTVHLTHLWINELSDRLGWDSKRDTLRLLRATLRQTRDHLDSNESAQFAAQLPILIRGMYYEGWIPAQTPIRDRKVEHFVSAIEEQVGDAAGFRGAEDITIVFQLITDKISSGEIKDIRASLPEAICALWPD